jgi:hypothetical protein
MASSDPAVLCCRSDTNCCYFGLIARRWLGWLRFALGTSARPARSFAVKLQWPKTPDYQLKDETNIRISIINLAWR